MSTESEKDALQKIVDDYINSSENVDSAEDLMRANIFTSFRRVHKKNPLLQIVDCLSSALTNTEVSLRARGTGLLAECIHQCPAEEMDKMEVDTLITFFCNRLKDHHSIQPMVLYAFLGLISYQEIPNQLIVTILQSIFTEVHVQSLIQADRRNVFNIFSNLLKTRIDALKPFGADFVFGFIQAMDSEKDPRNLVLCFENSYKIIKELDYEIFIEDLFEVLSCYFPVEFREPKEEQFRIKKDDLVLSLRKCLTAEKRFAPYAIPLYLEKLSSDLMDSKSDSLITFKDSLEIYNPEDVAIFIDDIWLAIRKDYLLSDHKELDSIFLELIYNLIKCLSKSDNKEPLVKIIDFLANDCLQTFKDPEMIIAVPCSKVILHASNACHFFFDKVVDRLILPIRGALEKYVSAHARSCMLQIVNRMLSVENENITPNTSLVEFVDYLIPLLYDLLENGETTSVQLLSLNCLRNIVEKSSWFEHCDFDIMAQHCFTLAKKKALTVQFISEFGLYVQVLSDKYPTIYKSQFIDTLEKVILCKKEDKIVTQCFTMLEYTSLENEELFQYLYSYFNTFASTDLQCIDVVLNCYINILKKNTKTTDGKLFVLPLINLLQSTKSTSDTFLKISQLLSVSFKLLNSEQYKATLMTVYEMFCDQCKDTRILFDSTINMNLDEGLSAFTILLRGVLTQIKPVNLNDIDVDRVCKGIISITTKIQELLALENYGIILGAIVNKLPADSTSAVNYVEMLRENISVGGESANASVQMLSWLTKGLVLNWQSATTGAIDLLTDSLNNKMTANTAAAGFGVIVKDIDFLFSKESSATIKLMYKQRYTQYVLPMLIERYYNVADEVKSFFLMAISNTLQAVPKQSLQKHLKAMMPLLMHSLATCNTPAITESTLSTILSVLTENHDAIVEYVNELINSLIKHMADNNMKIRMLSLKALAILSSYTAHTVLPMRAEVIRKVRPILGDKKRLVRKEAMFCSNAWYLMSVGS